jgi:hypothetical protein
MRVPTCAGSWQRRWPSWTACARRSQRIERFTLGPRGPFSDSLFGAILPAVGIAPSGRRGD